MSAHHPALRRPTRLVLVGPGHTHLEILRRMILRPLSGVELTVVAPAERHHYSGMVPGYLQGTYAEEETSLDVPGLVDRAGGRLVLAPATGLDAEARQVEVQGGDTVPYDLVSVAVGSTTVGFDQPEIADHASLVKPLGRVVSLKDQLLHRGRQKGGPLPVAVVGGGAAGVEVALAVQALLARDGGAEPKVSLFDGGDRLLADFSSRFQEATARVLRRREIAIHTGRRVARVTDTEVILDDGSRQPAEITVWLTGAVAYPWLAQSGLPVDDRGFLLVDRSLRSVADPRVFAAGDCATLEAAPETPKAGVFAVRHGPVLWRSLRATLGDGSFPQYDPQSDFLALLNTADGKALLRWRGWVYHGRSAWWLKDWIDRRFVRRYQRWTGSRPGR